VYVRLPAGEWERDREEFLSLIAGAGLQGAGAITACRCAPDPRTFVGAGKAAEIAERVRESGAGLVVFSHPLRPGQERNLERLLQCRVLDRTGLILDIFAQRARSYEGKLQVELAQLRHLSSRLVRGWSHLERQKGGIGLRGPGETQLETDRRLLGARIKAIRARLRKVRRRREENRRARQAGEVPAISLVGYTNAGKSTLFNRLTSASARVAPLPFVTLDPTLRRYRLGPGRHAVLADTVGFVRDLPADLVTAFQATLEETCKATLLLHVVDLGDPQRHERIAQVNQLIRQIGAGDIPQILVFNKIDRVPGVEPGIGRVGGQPAVYLSARQGIGWELLAPTVSELLWGRRRRYELRLPAEAVRIRSSLFSQGAVLSECSDGTGGWILRLAIERRWLDRLCRGGGLEHMEHRVELRD